MRMRRVTYGKALLCHAALCVMVALVVGSLSPLVVGATSSADAGPASYVSVASEASLSSRSELNVAAGAESSSSSSSSSFLMPSSSAESSGDGSMPSSASSLSHEESGRSSDSSESEKAVSESATSSSSASSLPNELSSDTSGNSESSTSSSELSSASSESRAESLPSSSSSSSFFPSSEEAESVSSSSSSGSEQSESLSSSSSSVASLSLSSESMSEHNASSSASSSSLPLSSSMSSSSSEAVGGSSSSESSSSGSNASTTSSSSSGNPSPVVPGVSGSVLITLVYDQRQVATGDVLGYVGDTLSSTYGVAGEVTRLMDDMDARETFWSLGGDGAANSRSRSTQATVAAAVTDTAATKPGDFGEAGSYFRTFLNVSGVEETTAQAFLSDVNSGKYQPRLLVASTWSVAELPVNKAWIAGIVVAAVVSVVAIVLVLVRFLPGCCKDRDARKQDEAYHSLNSYFDLEMQYTNHNNIAYETRRTGPSEPQQQWPVLLGREDSAGRLKPVAVAR